MLFFSFPNDDLNVLTSVARNRIVVSTLSSSGGFYKLGLSHGHFTHCIVDEAGEATEPETMIPIGLLASAHKSQIVLAGDPKQLGPVLLSRHAKCFGLEISLLERLSVNDLYGRDEERFGDHGNYDPMLVTKLVRNYRSHEDILRVPSMLFYDNELLPLGSPDKTHRFIGCNLLPSKDHPVSLHNFWKLKMF